MKVDTFRHKIPQGPLLLLRHSHSVIEKYSGLSVCLVT